MGGVCSKCTCFQSPIRTKPTSLTGGAAIYDKRTDDPEKYSQSIDSCTASNDKGVVVELSVTSNGDVAYRIGKEIVDHLQMGGSEAVVSAPGASNPAIAVNNDGILTACYSQEGKTVALAGFITDEDKIVWGDQTTLCLSEASMAVFRRFACVVGVDDGKVWSITTKLEVADDESKEPTVEWGDKVLVGGGDHPSASNVGGKLYLTFLPNNGASVIQVYNTPSQDRPNISLLFTTDIGAYVSTPLQGTRVGANQFGILHQPKGKDFYSFTVFTKNAEAESLSPIATTELEFSSLTSVMRGDSDNLFCFYLQDGSVWYNVVSKSRNRRWMSDHWADLKDKQLIELTLCGTHDSAAYNMQNVYAGDNVQGGTPEAIKNLLKGNSYGGELVAKVTKQWATAQSQTIGQQLAGGARFLDLRITRVDGVYWAHHTVLSVTLDSILKDMSSFMTAGAHEIVIFGISHVPEDADDSFHIDLFTKLEDALGNHLIQREAKESDTSVLFKKVKELASSRSRALFLYDDEWLVDRKDQYPFAYPMNNVLYTDYSNTNDPSVMENDQLKKLHKHGAPGADKLFDMQLILTPQVSDTLIGAFSLFDPPRNLRDLSEGADNVIETFGTKYLNGKYRANIILCDFYQRTEAVSISIYYSTR